MKKVLRFIAVTWSAILCTVIFSSAVFAQDASVTISCPSDKGSVIPVGNNFYVIGTVEGMTNFSVTVEMLSESGETLRKVSADKQNFTDGIYYEYDKLSYYGKDKSELKESFMPDLVYDGKNPDTFRDAWRKCYVGDKTYTALIYAFPSALELNFKDENGNPYKEITEGSYTIRVTASDGKTTQAAEKKITIGNHDEKLCARFSPSSHFDAAMNFAADKNLAVFVDPFAGYWSASDLVSEISGKGIFCEILPVWRSCEITEYSNGTVHTILYNIKPTCTTERVELGELQYTNRIDDTFFYYYTLGEPVLKVSDEEKKSEITAMEKGDKLEIIRTDSAEKSEEGTVDTTGVADVLLIGNDGKLNVSNGKIQIIGVIAPIQNEKDSVVLKDDLTYDVSDSIKTIRYTLTDKDGRVIDTFDRQAGISRIFGENWTEFSVYEFANVIDLSAYDTKPSVITVTAVDNNGNVVNNGTEKLNIELAQADEPATSVQPVTDNPKTSDSSTVLVIAFIAAAVSTAVIISCSRKKKNF